MIFLTVFFDLRFVIGPSKRYKPTRENSAGFRHYGTSPYRRKRHVSIHVFSTFQTTNMLLLLGAELTPIER